MKALRKSDGSGWIAIAVLIAAGAMSGTIFSAWGGEHERICQPGYAKSERLPYREYVPIRDEAFRRAGISVDRQCKASGENRASCFVLDHIAPLCLGGTWGPDNLQVQPRQEAENKDILEVATCRAYCRGDLSLKDALKRFGRTYR